MIRHRVLVASVALVGVAATPAVPVSAPAVDAAASRCATELTDAPSLVTDMATTVPVASRAGGVDIAVVTDPLVPPGIPTALLSTDAGLCTVDTFNLTVAPELGTTAEVATAFASTAGMPWLGEVEVRDLAVDGDTVTLTTFGGRHGVTSEWELAVDEAGIRSAHFETVAFGEGVELDHVEHLEGITSLPGNERTWTRDAAGILTVDSTVRGDLSAARADREADARRAAELAGLAPGELLEETFEDGQTVRFTVGVAATPVEGVRTGVGEADRLIIAHEGVGDVYRNFLSWGGSDPWGNTSRTLVATSTAAPDDAGYININSGFSAVCLACAFLVDAIEIHVEYAFPEIANALVGSSYPDQESFFVEVLAHELVHSMQGGYADGNVGLSNAFYEATASASQSLFDEAENSAQPGSIEYLDTGNGCEGFENGRGGWIAAQAAGPFLDGHSYDSCYFWWTYFAQHGGPGLISLLESQVDVAGADAADRNLSLLDHAAPTGDGTLDLAYWAAAYTAGAEADGYEITDGSGDVHDWFALLKPAQRSRDLAPGQSLGVDVADGGTQGFRVTGDGDISRLPAGAETFVYRVVGGAIQLVGPAVVGTPVSVGDILTVVAADGGAHQGTVALR